MKTKGIIGTGIVMVIIAIIANALFIGGAIWLIVVVLRHLGVIG